jgi:hypothetical protein
MVDVASLSAYVPRDARPQPTSIDLADVAGGVQIEVRRAEIELRMSTVSSELQ